MTKRKAEIMDASRHLTSAIMEAMYVTSRPPHQDVMPSRWEEARLKLREALTEYGMAIRSVSR